MKKVVLFTAVLMLAGSVSLFAADPALTLTPTGSASFTFGIDLDSGMHGISNNWENKLNLTILAAEDREKGGKEGEAVYGWIKLTGLEVSGEVDNLLATNGDPLTAPLNVKANEVAAKLFLGPVYVNVLGDDDNIDEASSILGAIVDIVTAHPAPVTLATQQAAEFQGFSIGLTDTSVVSVLVGVSSQHDWLDPLANVGNIYNLFAKVGLNAVPGLIAEVLFNTDTFSGDPMGFGAKAGYALDIAEGYKLTVTGAIDATLDTTTDLQITGDLILSFPGAFLDDWNEFGGAPVIDSFYPGLEARFTTDTTDHDLGVYFFDGDLLPIVNVIGILELYHLGASDAATGIGVYVNASIEGGITPHAQVWTVSTSAGTETLKVKAGVDLAVITNTTFTIDYTSAELKSSPGYGVLSFTTKIAY